MILHLAENFAQRIAAIFFLFTTATLVAAPTGPTLQLDYGRSEPRSNAINQFMYFVPLISPEKVSVLTNIDNTQCARVMSFSSRTNGLAFSATCEFDLTGEGFEQNIFDHAHKIAQNEKEFHAGAKLKRQLASINVTGDGAGSIEIAGSFTNGQRVVDMVQLRFNRRGQTSPVTINLQDLIYTNGMIQAENEMVARVNALTFRRTTNTPKMEVSLASLKRKDAGDGAWQNFLGSLKGATVNLFLPPLIVEPEGQQAMLDFGLALAAEKPTFTFPFATRLTSSGSVKP